MALRRAERARQHRLLEFNPEGVDADGQPLPCFDEDDSRFLDADIPEAEIAAADRRDSLAGAVEEDALPLAPSPPPPQLLLQVPPPPPVRRRVHSSDALGTTLVRPPSAARPVVVLGGGGGTNSGAGAGAGVFANSLRPSAAAAAAAASGVSATTPVPTGMGTGATITTTATTAMGQRGAVEVEWGALTLRTSVAAGMTVAELARKVAAQHAAMQGVPADAELDLLAPGGAVLADADRVFDLVAPGTRLQARVRAPRVTAPGVAPAVRTALHARATVRTLDLAAQLLDAGSLAALCAALPHLRVLERLSAAQTGLTAAHAPALAAALAACPALTALSLARNRLATAAPAQLAALARIALLPQLATLDLSGAALSPALLPRIARAHRTTSATPPALAHLNLADNDLLASQSAPALLAALTAYPALEEANLEHTGLTESSSLPLAALMVSLHPDPGDDEGGDGANHNGTEGEEEDATATEDTLPATLRCVCLRWNALAGAAGMLVVNALARLPALRLVDATRCRTSPAIFPHLLSLPAACVCAAENPLPAPLPQGVFSAVPSPRLRAIVLASCALDLTTVAGILRTLLAAPELTAIDLSGNSGGDDRVKREGDDRGAAELEALGVAKGGFRALTVLDLSRCGVPSAVATHLAALWRTAHPSPAPGSSVLVNAALDQLLLGSRSALRTHLQDTSFFM